MTIKLIHIIPRDEQPLPHPDRGGWAELVRRAVKRPFDWQRDALCIADAKKGTRR